MVSAGDFVVWVVLNDLFFSALGWFLGVWSYREYCRFRESRNT